MTKLVLISSRLRLQMVILTKTALCKRCWEYTRSCSSRILWYRLHKITHIFMSSKSKKSTENHFLWTSQTVCISCNRRCMEKISSPANWGNREIWPCFGISCWWAMWFSRSVLHTTQYLQLMPQQTKLSILGLFMWRFETAFITVDCYV